MPLTGGSWSVHAFLLLERCFSAKQFKKEFEAT
jgi:hypothetical protein